LASSELSIALLDSIGKNHLESKLFPLPLYDVTPRQIIDAMITKYSNATGQDITRPGAPGNATSCLFSGECLLLICSVFCLFFKAEAIAKRGRPFGTPAWLKSMKILI
jgi:hypothetical protein